MPPPSQPNTTDPTPLSGPNILPPNLPIPQDDGACDHLGRAPFDRFPPDLDLPSTDGSTTNIAHLIGQNGTSGNAPRVVFFFYPRTGIPGQPPAKGFRGEDWDEIPGARGCTPHSCAFRDHFAEFAALGGRIFGVSTNSTEHQREFKSRQHIPFEFLSDRGLRLVRSMRLPTFEFPVESGGPTTLVQRLAIFCDAGRIRKVWYPVFPSDQNAPTVLRWLRERPAREASLRTALIERWREQAAAISLRPLEPRDREWIRPLFTHHFGGTDISSRRQWFDTEALPGIVAEYAGRPAGVAVHTPLQKGRECELVALASPIEGIGAGSRLLEACTSTARAAGCRRIFLTTSNDNTEAMKFYQKRGWSLAAAHPGSLSEARRAKPGIPELGHDGIPIRDDVEFEIKF